MARFPFLTATWSNLINLTYGVPPDLLAEHLPDGLELDVQDGHAFVSLVAFDFLDTRVFGVPWPGYRNFPELNLRFYVKHNGERGVVFIREFVPKALIARSAELFYNEPYRSAPMWSEVDDDGEKIRYKLGIRYGGREHTILAHGRYPTSIPGEDTVAHYFKEHKWGYGRDRRGRTLVYEVEHPVWETYEFESHELDVDFGLLYGAKWAFLNETEPLHRVFAVGSAIKVFPKS